MSIPALITIVILASFLCATIVCLVIQADKLAALQSAFDRLASSQASQLDNGSVPIDYGASERQWAIREAGVRRFGGEQFGKN